MPNDAVQTDVVKTDVVTNVEQPMHSNEVQDGQVAETKASDSAKAVERNVAVETDATGRPGACPAGAWRSAPGRPRRGSPRRPHECVSPRDLLQRRLVPALEGRPPVDGLDIGGGLCRQAHPVAAQARRPPITDCP